MRYNLATSQSDTKTSIFTEHISLVSCLSPLIYAIQKTRQKKNSTSAKNMTLQLMRTDEVFTGLIPAKPCSVGLELATLNRIPYLMGFF